MKQFIIIAAFVAVACARPRYVVLDLNEVEFIGDGEPLEVVPLNRFRRAAQEEVLIEEVPQRPQPQFRRGPSRDQFQQQPQFVENRRQDGPGPQGGPGPDSFIGAIGAAGIQTAADNLAAGSNAYASPPSGSDYVDYGAYTGKHGAFGWYSDHPVLLIAHHGSYH